MAIRIRPKDGERLLEQDAALAVKLASSRPWIVSGLALSNGTGLDASIGTGLAWIDGYVVELDAAEAATCAASDTNHIFLELAVDGNDLVTGLNVVVNTTGTAPSGPYVKLGTATTDGSSVTGTATTGRSPEVQTDPIPTDADEISYDNSTSGLTATDVEGALDELAARPASGGWTGVAVESANRTRVSTTTFAADNLLFAAASNKSYAFEIVFMIQGNTSGVNTKVTVTAPSGATGDWQITSLNNSPTYSAPLIQFSNAFAASVQIASGATRNHVVIHGVVTTGITAGNVEFKWAQQSSNGSAMTIYKGANIKWKEIT